MSTMTTRQLIAALRRLDSQVLSPHARPTIVAQAAARLDALDAENLAMRADRSPCVIDALRDMGHADLVEAAFALDSRRPRSTTR